MRTSIRLFFITMLTALLCNACGYRGPLYMPGDKPPQSKTILTP